MNKPKIILLMTRINLIVLDLLTGDDVNEGLTHKIAGIP